MKLASALQVAGATVMSCGIGLVSVPAGLIAAGLSLLTFGIAVERGAD